MIEDQLRPHLVKTKPRWLRTTGQAKERPHEYVGDVSKSIVFQVTGSGKRTVMNDGAKAVSASPFPQCILSQGEPPVSGMFPFAKYG